MLVEITVGSETEAYQIKGQGKVDLQRHDLDVMLLVNIKKGWGKENDFIRQLAKMNAYFSFKR